MSRRYGGRQPPEQVQHRLSVREHEVLTRRPTKQAALQMEPGEAAYDFIPATTVFWEVPPEVVAKPRVSPNFSGATFGRLTVVGLIDLHYENQGGPVKHLEWLVRCACGLYERRSSISIKAKLDMGAATDARCHRCTYAVKQYRNCFFDKNGFWPPTHNGVPHYAVADRKGRARPEWTGAK